VRILFLRQPWSFVFTLSHASWVSVSGLSVEERAGIIIKSSPQRAAGHDQSRTGEADSAGDDEAGAVAELEADTATAISIGYTSIEAVDEESRRYAMVNRPFEMINVGLLRELLAQVRIVGLDGRASVSLNALTESELVLGFYHRIAGFDGAGA
jgi:hypothetical protein